MTTDPIAAKAETPIPMTDHDINRVLAELAGHVIATKGRAVTHTKVLYDDDNGLWFAGGMMQWSPTTNRNDLAEVLAKLTDGQWALVEIRLLPVYYQSDFEGGFIHWTHICDPRIIAEAVAEVVK